MYYDNVLRDGLGHFDGIVVVIPYDEVLVWPCSAYYIRTGPPYALMNGKWDNVSAYYNPPQSALSSSRLSIEWPSGTNIPLPRETPAGVIPWTILHPRLLVRAATPAQ